MYYTCPNCKKKYKFELGDLSNEKFGRCPVCDTDGTLLGESQKNLPEDEKEYEAQ